MPSLDTDLEQLTRTDLIAEVIKLRSGIRAHRDSLNRRRIPRSSHQAALGIRAHRDSSGHELCWHHPALWSLLPEPATATPTVPAWPAFLRGCIRYRQSLDEQLPDAPRSEKELSDGTEKILSIATDDSVRNGNAHLQERCDELEPKLTDTQKRTAQEMIDELAGKGAVPVVQ